MKTEEDEAFDELAKRQGAWGGGFKAKQAMAADKLWDKPSVAFDEWWNGDNDESTNPFRLESGAYWAWAGWKAALAQPPLPEQEPVAQGSKEHLKIMMEHSAWDDRLELSDALANIDEFYATAPPLPVQEPEYWNVIDPAGNIVASETDAIRGWARIAGSYKPTVEGLLGFHDQGWRVLPKIAPPAAQPAQEPEMLTIAYQSGYYDGKKAALAGREWNFCERCGKRTADLTVIHTCTPPQDGA